MNTSDYLGLDASKVSKLIDKLNSLLASYHIFYMNLRGFHWNIKGEKFFELHQKFEELYDDVSEKIDEIAERILTLGGTPLHSFTDYLAISEIKEQTNISQARATLSSVLEAFKLLLARQRAILELASEASDEGTSALMSDYIREQEKLVWMYSSIFNN